jgi:hypothetical protein
MLAFLTRRPLLLAALLAALVVGCTEDSPVSDDANNASNNASGNNASANNADPNNADPNNSDPNNADPNNADPNNADPNNFNSGANNPNNADPNNASTNNADPNNADPNNANNTPDSLIGAPCAGNADCGFGGLCIPEAEGFTDGYCITACDPGDPLACPGDGVCAALGENDLCVDGCGQDADCRDGYVCATWIIPGEAFCFPGACREDADCGPDEACARGVCGNTLAVTGSACEDSSDCQPGGACIPEEPDAEDPDGPRFWGGYCTLIGCAQDADCAGGGRCAFNGELNVCLDPCEQPADCREGYACALYDGALTCLPGQCAQDADCEVGQCVNGQCGDPDARLGDACGPEDPCGPGAVCASPESEGDGAEFFYGGYCARLGCDPLASGGCGEEGVCVVVDEEDNGVCLLGCEADADCREGGLYQCRQLVPGGADPTLACLPTFCEADGDCPESYACQASACVPR